MVSQDKAFLERLRALKDKSGMTTKQIADKSGIPESTITRIFSGKTPNPTIISTMDIIRAMGGKASDVFDDNAQVNTQLKVPQVVVSEMEQKNNEITSLYKNIITSKDELIKEKNKTIKMLITIIMVLVSIFVILLLLDIFDSGMDFLFR